MKYLKFFFIIIFFLLFNTCRSHINKKLPNAQKLKNNEIYKYANGILTYKEGIPILELKGTNYEMGYQYGVLLRNDMKKISENISKMKKIYISQQPYLAKFFSGMYINIKLNKIINRIPNDYKEELRGMADGSGIDFKDLLLINVSGNIIQGRCAAIISNDNANIIHGRNFDLMPYFLSDYFVIVNYKGDNKKEFTNFGIITYLGSFQGINNNGISVALNYGEGAYNKKYEGLPIGFKIRKILEETENMNDVDKLLKKYENDEPGSILSICSFKENKGRIYDIFEDEVIFSEYNVKENISPLYAFNSIFNNDRLNDDFKLSKKHLSVDVGLYGNNEARENRAKKIIEEHNKDYSKKFIFDFLSDTGFYNYDEFIGSGNYLTISNEYTLFSLLFDYNNNKIYFAKGHAYAGNNKIYYYDIIKNEIEIYKEESEFYKKNTTIDFIDWFSKYQIMKLKKEYKEIKKSILEDEYIYPQKIIAAYLLYINDKKNINNEKLINLINKGIEKYPDYYLFYYMKGRYYQKEKKYKEAAEEYEKSISSNILFEYSKINIYEKLYETNKKLKNKEKSEIYAKKFLNEYKEKEEKYKMPKYMKKKYKKISHIF